MTSPETVSALMALVRAGLDGAPPAAASDVVRRDTHCENADYGPTSPQSEPAPVGSQKPRIGNVIGWPAIVALAKLHDLTPLLSAGIVASEAVVPNADFRALRLAARASELRNTRALDELHHILTAFASRSIPTVVLKGAALASTRYRSPGLRPFGDLDLLVSQDHRAAAAEVLEGLGYEGKGDATAWWTQNHNHWVFDRDGALRVELHWALTAPLSSVQMDTRTFIERSEAVRAERGTIRTLCAEYLVLHMAVHAATHQFRVALREYVDLSAVINTTRLLNWNLVFQTAEGVGASADLSVFLRIAQFLGAAQPPPEIIERCDAQLPPRFPLASAAQYAVEWPTVDTPAALIHIAGAAHSRRVKAAAGLLRRPGASGWRTAAEPSAEAGSLHSETGSAVPWYHRLNKLRRAYSQREFLQAAIVIRRHFGDREAP